MAEPVDPKDRENHAGSPSAGCAVFLIDESPAMDARVADGTKSKAQCIATALNSLLNQLTAGPELNVAVVGYRGDASGGVDVGCRWGGPLQEQMFVRTGRLADTPVTVEDRVRKIPGPGGIGVARQQTVRFPVWYVPKLGGPVSAVEAWEFCHGLLSSQHAAPKPPLVLSFLGEPSDEGSLRSAVSGIELLQFPGGPPLVFHAHLSSSARVPPTLYPSADAHLQPGMVREVFGCSSVLPDPMAAALRQLQVTVNPGARGMIYSAKMVDLIRFLSLVKVYAEYQPPANTPVPPQVVPESTGIEPVALIVLLVDRSVENPAHENSRKVWARLQDHANELLGRISKRGDVTIEAALVSYGAGADGQTEVQTGFGGPLGGETFAGDAELAEGALRVDKVTEQVSNGIGGLVELTRKKPIFVELEPTPAAAAGPALETAARLVADWCGRHPQSPLAPVVLHLTRGRHDPDQYHHAVAQMHQVAGSVLLYHLVVTEFPHRSLAYPGQPAEMVDPGLMELWELSGPLPGSRQLAARRPDVAADSRGIVINGKFDLLLEEGIRSLLSPESTPGHDRMAEERS